VDARDSNPLIWLDMEMTGLDPEQCVPIEVAVVVTDASLGELATMEAVIHQPDSALEQMSEIVREMHTANGLIDRVRGSTRQLAEVDQELASLVSGYAGDHTGVLAGNSIHTDRLFVKRYFPLLESLLHYRMVDVSSLKELVRRWYGEDALYAKPDSDHTALADARASIAELAFYRQTCFRAG
jgi:oligoribonuclease